MSMLIKIANYLLHKTSVIPIFVIGTGRSGTHWLGFSLRNHPEIRATIEIRPMFFWSTTMALDPNTQSRYLWKLILMYRWQLFLSAPRHYLDKSHPNIWIAEQLKEAFPNALFLGIERNPYATVASMILHNGVLSWHDQWRKYPVPNKFLGIDRLIASKYDDLPLATKCAMRWLSHHARMIELKTVLGASLKIISYENFAENTQATIRDIEKFLSLSNPIPVPEVKRESLHKWRYQLSSIQIRQVQDVVGFLEP